LNITLAFTGRFDKLKQMTTSNGGSLGSCIDDSLNSAIHTTYRNWLRSSSMHEPRDPPLEVVLSFVLGSRWTTTNFGISV
ncbi:MAG: hypothetical protein AAGK05_19770, partial [Pseudomonadota bacterium]